MKLSVYSYILLFSILFVTICYSLVYIEPFQTQQEKYLEDAFNRTKLKYHISEKEIREQENMPSSTVNIIDDDGNPLQIPRENTQAPLLVYQAGSRPYEHYSFDYADAIALSKM